MITANLTDSENISYSEDSFETLFKLHFKALHAYAITILRDEEDAEEIVQQVFLKLWEKRHSLSIEISVKAYLYKAVYHHCLNHLRDFNTRLKHQGEVQRMTDLHDQPASAGIEMNELQQRLNKAMNELPEQCRTIFQLSRFENLKYREIAVQLGLSVKTVENQMGKALKTMRFKMADLLVLLVLGVLYFKDLLKF